jgi:hypothetical protein
MPTTTVTLPAHRHHAAATAAVPSAARPAQPDLPDPVQRYFEHVLAAAQRPVRSVHMAQAGTLRTGTGSRRWLEFRARHEVHPASRSFAWNAAVRVLPLVTLRVQDSYARGVGSGRIGLAGLTLASDQDRPELNAGSLHRYLAEAVWYPTALLPQAGVNWTALDRRRARATLSDAGLTVSLEFRFDDDGLVSGIYTPERWYRAGRGYHRVPWEGRFEGYRRHQGLLVPTHGEVGWHRDGRLETVWKGDILSLDYEFAPAME